MTPSNHNLTPTVITDKNGKVTTVHKKLGASNASSPTVPAPVISDTIPPLPSKAELVRRIAGRVQWGYLAMDTVSAKVRRWVDAATPEQLTVINEAVGSSFDDSSEHEQSVVIGILNPFTTSRGDTRAIHELLTLRKAFCSDWAIRTEPGTDTDSLDEFVYGLRGPKNFSQPLDLSDERTNEKHIALLRFAYEIAERAGDADYLPTEYYVLDEYTEDNARVYRSEDLKALIGKYADRVDDIIELAVTNETSDAHKLRALLEHKGHSSLVYGML